MRTLLALAGLCLAGIGPSTRSESDPPAAVPSAPGDPGRWVTLGDELMQRSRERPDGQLYEGAEAAYRRALGVDPRHVPALVGMAWVANSRHEFDAGRRWARAALNLEPRLPEAHALLGDAAMEAGDYDEAFEHYQTCLDERPNLSSYSRAAHLLWLTGDARRAKALMHRAIRAGGPDPENVAWCRAELGLMLFNEGAIVLAEKQIEQALSASPGNPHVLSALGRIRAARGKDAEAIQAYEKAVAIAPHHAALEALVDLYARTGESAKSERAFRRVLEYHAAHQHEHRHATPLSLDVGLAAAMGTTNSLHTHGSSELARFLADHDRELPWALQEAEAACQNSKSVYALDALAWCLYKNGRLDEARSAMRRALRWRTPDASLLFHAGMIHAALGDRPGAQRYLYQALNLNPDFDPIQSKQAVQALARLGSHAADPMTFAQPVGAAAGTTVRAR